MPVTSFDGFFDGGYTLFALEEVGAKPNHWDFPASPEFDIRDLYFFLHPY